MYDKIKSIFQNVELNQIDNNSINIIDMEIYQKIIQLNKKIKIIFDEARKKNEFEFQRTIRHTFRTVLVYFEIIASKFKQYNNLDDISYQRIKLLIKKIYNINREILPSIFLFHDIGKPFNQKFHPFESAKIIEKYGLLNHFNLNRQEKLIVNKVIKYHLMMGTIYNGESSLWALKNLINDPDISEILDNNELLSLYLDLFVIFAIIDIWGYPYGIVLPNNVHQYLKLKDIFYELLSIKNNAIEFQSQLEILSFQRIGWRIANAIRIFQFHNSDKKYTLDFFLKKIWTAIREYNGDIITKENWNEYKRKYLKYTPRIQMTYGLPILMRLALGPFKKRKWKIDEHTTISPDLIEFWIALNTRIEQYILNNNLYDFPINVIWKGLPHWSKYNDRINRLLNGNDLRKIIEKSKIRLIDNKKEYNLILDFSEYLK
ncbi:MAG: hypothetical protein ACTSPY_00950 [Candidatus Helarchaeota archaeon]